MGKPDADDLADAALGGFQFPGEILVHPFYISWTKTWRDDPTLDADAINLIYEANAVADASPEGLDFFFGDGNGADAAFNPDGSRAPHDLECISLFGPTDPANPEWYGLGDGLADWDSALPCVVSIVNATSRSQFAQRRYSNYVFGAAWERGAEGGGRYRSYGPRAFHKEDYGFSPLVNSFIVAAGDDGNNELPWQYTQLSPNTWSTQDAIFQLCQSSGFFLAFGITFHIIAFLMGGFIWNYSKCCCDFGVCGFVFNSIVWSSLSLICYIMSICAFAGVFFQGRAHDAEDQWLDADGNLDPLEIMDLAEENRLKITWSPGGGLLITNIVFSAIAISLASYQWAKDRNEDEEDKMEAAVEEAVRRVGGV